jgi:hypothetical protein
MHALLPGGQPNPGRGRPQIEDPWAPWNPASSIIHTTPTQDINISQWQEHVPGVTNLPRRHEDAIHKDHQTREPGTTRHSSSQQPTQHQVPV